MAKDETLKRAEADIQSGNLGKARDRLHGLIASYPQDLSLRSRLGEVYWRLQDPAMAGRYWFLGKHDDEQAQVASSAFARDCGDSPYLILRRLKIRFDPEQLEDAFARERIEALVKQCRTRYGKWGVPSELGHIGKAVRRHRHRSTQARGWLAFIVYAALIVCFIIFILGVVHVAGWFGG